MPELRLADLVEATGGTLLRGDPATRVDLLRHRHPDRWAEAASSSRSTGERTDGHDFLARRRARGVAAAVVERAPEEGRSRRPRR